MKRKDAFTKAQWKQETYRVCKECTTQKREAGIPYRCTQCGLWRAAAHFASKHHNPRWSMYRVCLSCDAKEQCFLCQIKKTKEYFSHVVWQTRDPKRRLCLQCQTKTRGSWKCAVCHQRRSRHHFSNFISRRPSSKRGWNADMRHMPRCEDAASSPQARCCFQYSPPRASPEKTCAADKLSRRHGKQSPQTRKHAHMIIRARL